MGYKQIDGVKDILVNEKGQVRHLLRNLPPDSDRFEYARDDDGQKLNEWPMIVVDVDEEGEEDKRLLPEVVLKLHGKLPDKVDCTRSDFESKSGTKHRPIDSAIDNVKYVGDGSAAKGGSPYKQSPDKEKEQEQEAPANKEQEVVEETQEAEQTPEEKTDQEIDRPTPEGGEEISDLQKGSGALTAKRAQEIIKKYDFEELSDAGFYTEDTRDGDVRVTVKDAWEKKQKDFEESK